MDELSKLQEEFRLLQEEDTSHQLAERNCVEIILKLQQMKLIELIYSTDGKHFITPDHLTNEIIDELDAQRGRMNIVEVPALLNVELSHISQKCSELVRKKKDFRLLDGELIRDYYLDLVAEEISETLLEDGQFKVSDLAARFSLTTEFMTNLIETRLGKQLQGKLEGGFLYTQAYISRLEARIRGAFSAITTPTGLYTIQTQFNVPESLFQGIVDNLFKEKVISGVIQGKSQLFVPTVFVNARQKYLESFFQTNLYLLYEDLEKFHITDGKEYLKNRFGGQGIALNYIFISPTLIANMEAAVLEAIETKTWLDILDHLPSMMSAQDVFLCLQNSKSIQKELKSGNAVQLTENIIISSQLVSKLLQLIEDYLKENLSKTITPASLSTSTSSAQNASGESEIVEDDGKDKRGRTRGRGGAPASNVQEEEEVEEKGKGARRGKGGRRGKGDDEEPAPPPSTAKKGPTKQPKQTPSRISPEEEEKILTVLKRNIEESGSEEGEKVVSQVYTSIRGRVIEMKEQLSRTIFFDNSKQKKNENALESVDDLYSNFQMFSNAIPTFNGDTEILEKHLLKTIGILLFNQVLEHFAVQQFVDLSKFDLQQPNGRQNAINALPSSKTAFDKLHKTLSGKSSQEFLDEFQTVCDEIGIKLKKLDKKRERQLVFHQRQNLLTQLTTEQDPSAAFHLVVIILYIKVFSVVLHAPGRSIAAILSQLASATSSSSEPSNNKKEEAASGGKGGKGGKGAPKGKTGKESNAKSKDKDEESSSATTSGATGKVLSSTELQFLQLFHQNVVKYLTAEGKNEEVLRFFEDNLQPLKNLVLSPNSSSSSSSNSSSLAPSLASSGSTE